MQSPDVHQNAPQFLIFFWYLPHGDQDRYRLRACQAYPSPRPLLAPYQQGMLPGLSAHERLRCRHLARPRPGLATGKQLYKALGELKDLPDHQRFDAAQKAAQAWFEHLGRGGSARGHTVADVCDKYVQHMKATSTDRAAEDIEARFKNYVLNHRSFAETDVAKLTPAHLERWRKALRELPTRSGARRGELRSDST